MSKSVGLPWFRHGIVLMAVLFLFSAAQVRAQERCPWLNAATAADVLETNVATIVSHTSANNMSKDTVCEFIHKKGAELKELRVQVETMSNPAVEFASYLSRCGSNPQPLKAIGNEAATCVIAEKKALVGEAIGRVRDRAFIIVMRFSDKSIDDSALREKARRVSEQIAGNLF